MTKQIDKFDKFYRKLIFWGNIVWDMDLTSQPVVTKYIVLKDPS